MPYNKWTKPNRLTEVTRLEIREEVVGLGLGPTTDIISTFSAKLSGLKDGDTVWCTRTTTRTGLDKESFGFEFFATEKEALEAVNALPVGTVWGDGYGFPMRFKDLVSDHQAARTLSMLFGVGDADEVDFICYDAFFEAGVTATKFGGPSQQVLDWVGEEHVAWMKEEFRENWECVAIFEYTLSHFPDSSLVGLAAKLHFARFATHDDFVAGYLVKEIQTIAGGTENAAVSSVEAKRKAGAGGGRASSQRRHKNLENLMNEIENLAGAVGIFSEVRIVEQAFEAARGRSPNLPKSKKTLDDYGTALRSEEPFKSRYEAVFRKNT